MSKKKNKAKVISFSNHKGGVGKSCSTCNIGAGLARIGKKVLLIDMDPQANLSISLGAQDVENNIYKVMIGECSVSEAIYFLTENLYIVPGTLDLAGAEVEIMNEPGRELILRKAIEPEVEKYDYILIDCPPSLGLLTTNALTAADEVYVPLQAQYLAVQGIEKLQEIISKVRTRLNKNLIIGGVIITQFDSRKVLNRDIAEKVEEYFAKEVFATKIRDNVSLAEAPTRGIDIFRYNPKCYGSLDYKSLCDEIICRSK